VQRFKEMFLGGEFMLDIEAENLEAIAAQICKALVSVRAIENEFSSILKATLLARHHHKDHHNKHQAKQHDSNACHREVMPTIKAHQNTVDLAVRFR